MFLNFEKTKPVLLLYLIFLKYNSFRLRVQMFTIYRHLSFGRLNQKREIIMINFGGIQFMHIEFFSLAFKNY